MDANALVIMLSTLAMFVAVMSMPPKRWYLSFVVVGVWITVLIALCDDNSSLGREIAGYKQQFNSGWHIAGKP